jgi:hypothetical protein
MKYLFFILISFLTSCCCIAQQPYSIRDLKSGKFTDDSSYIYSLPFKNKKKIFLIQAYDSKLSHKGERALDFKIKKKNKDLCCKRWRCYCLKRGLGQWWFETREHV